ncbi:MAG: glycosyltransferase family 39 protein [Bacteroidales bacterium]|nr:glycosyltransferase family 39 protein [Bacteroidales bacterium]
MKKALPLYIIVVAAFLLLIGDSLFTTGMFVDSLIYSNIAANMAAGIGDIWHPVHSDSMFLQFYEHPTLAMWLLSLFYRAFGTSLWVARGYAMLIVLITAGLTLRLWVLSGFRTATGWMPLLLWTLVPVVTLSSHNIMLECTMAVFVLSAVICLLHPVHRQWERVLWAAAGGVFLCLAFLTKGFTGIYPLAFPGILWLIDILCPTHGQRRQTLGGAVLQTFVMSASATACICLLSLIQPEAWEYIGKYVENQVVGGMKVPVVDSRWYIIVKFFEQTVIVWGIAALALIAAWISHRKGHSIFPARTEWRTFSTFLILTLSGVIPIMVSTKQRDFYILTVFPFFAVAVASLIHNIIDHWLNHTGRTFAWIVSSLAIIVTAAAIWLNISYYDKPGRDITLQNDMKLILPYLEDGEHVAIPTNMCGSYSLLAYYYREKRVSLMPVDNISDTTLPYRHILTDGAVPNLSDGGIKEIALGTEEYKLYTLVHRQ